MQSSVVSKIVKQLVASQRIIRPPVPDLERIWIFIETALSSIYPRIRFYVCDPINQQYYGFKSYGMDKSFSRQFDCIRENPFRAKNYPIGFFEVPSSLKKPIYGNEESYLLTTELIKGWCLKRSDCPTVNCRENNDCPNYVADIFINFESNNFIIDQSLTIHIPHPLNKEVPLGALSLDYGKRNHSFTPEECETLQFLLGTCLGAISAPLIDLDRQSLLKNKVGINTEACIELSENKEVDLKEPPILQDYEAPFSQYGMVFNRENESMMAVINRIESINESAITVLITGESGTGKELVAKAIHSYGNRGDKKFCDINCAAIPRDLLESELFGHEKGAFTGAVTLKKGKFELADQGTIFLDEIGDMPLALQAKILRVLQEKQIVRIGGTKNIPIDVRIIAATNNNLEEKIQKGAFREDLFYRLDGMSIHLPPLREREIDLLPLIRHFCGLYSREMGRKQPLYIEKSAFNLLVAYDWPGNIRVLKNTIEVIITLYKKERVLKIEHLPDRMQKEIENKCGSNQMILLWPGETSSMVSHDSQRKSAAKIHQDILMLKGRGVKVYLKKLTDEEKELLKKEIKQLTLNRFKGLKALWNEWCHKQLEEEKRKYPTFHGYFVEAHICFNGTKDNGNISTNHGIIDVIPIVKVSDDCVQLLGKTYNGGQIKNILEEYFDEKKFWNVFREKEQYAITAEKTKTLIRDAKEAAQGI